jgi:hypothetical protein
MLRSQIAYTPCREAEDAVVLAFVARFLGENKLDVVSDHQGRNDGLRCKRMIGSSDRDVPHGSKRNLPQTSVVHAVPSNANAGIAIANDSFNLAERAYQKSDRYGRELTVKIIEGRHQLITWCHAVHNER